MKKMRVFFFILLCLAIFSSCQSNNLQHTTGMEEKSNTDDCHNTRYLDNIEKYRGFIKESPLPSEFVTYEMLAGIGEFKSFCSDWKDVLWNDFNEYRYELISENNQIIEIVIRHPESLYVADSISSLSFPYELEDAVHLEEPPKDGMKTSQKTFIELNGVYYGYNDVYKDGSGEICFILVNIGENYVTFSLDPRYDYSSEDNTLLSCLLKGNPDNFDLSSYLIQEIKVNDVTIRKGMTYQEVVELMGNEGTSLGFGLIIYAWDISEDEVLYVWFQKGVTDSWDDMTVDSFEIKNKSEISE